MLLLVLLLDAAVAGTTPPPSGQEAAELLEERRAAAETKPVQTAALLAWGDALFPHCSFLQEWWSNSVVYHR